MMKKAGRRPARAFVAGLLSVGLLAGLGGCGGGGGTPSDGGNAMPTSVDAGGLSTPVDTSSKPSHYQALGVSLDGGKSRVVLIVDVDTQKTVRQYPVNTGWTVTDRIDLDPATGLPRYLGMGHLYMVLDGKVMQLDLSGDTLGQPKQISSITNACGVARGGISRNLAVDGKHLWLQVSVPDPGNSCATVPSGFATHYVSSDMPANEVGPIEHNAFHTGIRVLSTLTDKKLVAQGVLVFDHATQRLSVYSNDLKRELYVVKEKIISGTEQISFLGTIVDPQRGLLQAAGRLYKLDWRGNRLTMSDVLASAGASGRFIYGARDPANAKVYLSDGVSVYVATDEVDKVTLLGRIDTALGAVNNIVNTGGALVVSQFLSGSETASGLVTSRYSLVAMNKATGVRKTIASGSQYQTIVGAQGDTVLFQRWRPDGLSPEVVRYDVARDIETVARRSDGAVADSTWYFYFKPDGLGSTQTAAQVWFEPGDVDGKPAVNVWAYDGVSGNAMKLGTLPAKNESPFTNYNYLSYFSRWAPGPTMILWNDQIWQYTPDQAGSLRQIELPVH